MKAWVIAAALCLLPSLVAAEPAAPMASGTPPVAAQGASTVASPPPTAGVAKPPKPPKPKLICEETKALGSLMTSQVCATQAQWDARRRNDTAEIDRMRDTASSNATGGP